MRDISRRRFLASAAAGISAAALPFASLGQQQRRPNIILCMADDQGWGDMAYNGHPMLKTPEFDALAKAGLRFDRFYAAAPVCSPTRGSVMTGRHPNRYGVFQWGWPLRPQEKTLPEALQQAGYVTGHFGKWHLGSVRKGSEVDPGDHGFDTWLSAPNFYDNDPILSREGEAVQLEGESSMVTMDAALDFIREHAAGEQPFFAVIWFGSPHNPHEAAPEFRALYEEAHPEKADFLGEISGMDAAVGKLRRSLREDGIAQDTILWYCSDNGGLPNLGRTGGRAHKGEIYEGGLRVPAILEWPGRLEASTTDVPCSTVDIYPTVLRFAGANVENQPVLDGIDLTPLLEGRMKQRPQPLGFWDYPTRGFSTPSAELMGALLEAQQKGENLPPPDYYKVAQAPPPRETMQDYPGHSAWLDWPWKLHRIHAESETRWELYQLEEDPDEARDLSAKAPERVDPMRAELEAWLASVLDSLYEMEKNSSEEGK